MKKTTIMIEDTNRYEFRRRLEEVLDRYNEDRIFNIDTGMVHDKYDYQGCPKMYYYAIIIVKGDPLYYDVSETWRGVTEW